MSSTTFEIDIEELAAGGDGVGRVDGKVVFVPRAAPGDRVQVRVVEDKKSFARGELVAVARASADRVEAPCPLFRAATCGGCQWQHVAYAAQARAKEQIVRGALRRLVAAGLVIEPIAAPVPEYGWRWRAWLHWVRRRKGEVLIGFHAPRSERITDVHACPQIEPALERVLGPLHERLGPGLSGDGEIDVIAGAAGDVHVAIHGPCAPEAAEALASSAAVAGVRLGKRVFGGAAVELEPGLRGGAEQFAQASAAGNAALIAVVDAATAPRAGLRILELHAGSGNLTRILSREAAQVVAVDSGGHGIDAANVTYLRADAAAHTETLAAAGEHFDLALLDPPRTGDLAAARALAALKPGRIVYVSCDPATLARDADALVSAGYRPERAWPLDLMPQTAHVEVVLALRS
ncbi:MAG TPA: TRAM domain-containing protein [Kofleriaceae bacterium]|nr:TRAM domain-containing protein [Kofleriaceae bacterium]